jgi:dipeptidyl aminopeptidase/acylaminoacyl peptidase
VLNRFASLNAGVLAAVTAALLLAIGYVVVSSNIGAPAGPTPTPQASAFGEDDALAYTLDGDLWVASADGVRTRQLTNSGGVGAAAWSPDGALLAYDMGGDLYVMDAEGTARLVAEGGAFYGPAWSPDGRQLVVNAADGFAIVGLDGEIRELTQKAIGLCVTSPDWGPSGLIVFTGNPDCATGAEPTSLYVMNPDGSGVRELFGHGSQVSEAAWSPDGERIAFIDLANEGCIYVMEADGTSVTQVKPRCTKGFPLTWAPAGNQLAWAGGPHGDAPPFVINVDGTGLQALTGLGSVANLTWRPIP